MFHIVAKAGLENCQWIYNHPSSMSKKQQGASKIPQLVRYFCLHEEVCCLQLTASFCKDGLQISIQHLVTYVWKSNQNAVLQCSNCQKHQSTHFRRYRYFPPSQLWLNLVLVVLPSLLLKTCTGGPKHMSIFCFQSCTASVRGMKEIGPGLRGGAAAALPPAQPHLSQLAATSDGLRKQWARCIWQGISSHFTNTGQGLQIKILTQMWYFDPNHIVLQLFSLSLSFSLFFSLTQTGDFTSVKNCTILHVYFKCLISFFHMEF